MLNCSTNNVRTRCLFCRPENQFQNVCVCVGGGGGGGGGKPTIGIMSFNLWRSQVRKKENIVWMRVLQFSFRKYLFFFVFPLFNSVKKKLILRRKSIGGASVPPPLVPHQVTPLFESVLIYSWFISRCQYFRICNLNWPIPVAAWSNAWVFGRPLAGTAGAKSAGGV